MRQVAVYLLSFCICFSLIFPLVAPTVLFVVIFNTDRSPILIWCCVAWALSRIQPLLLGLTFSADFLDRNAAAGRMRYLPYAGLLGHVRTDGTSRQRKEVDEETRASDPVPSPYTETLDDLTATERRRAPTRMRLRICRRCRSQTMRRRLGSSTLQSSSPHRPSYGCQTT
ncbi:hypothetical protein A0H81_11654 [Grifola frondosa]|uniref:Uncharacterized protein n=1 Tax=Grifola frondosa TaxID=5627 RepID=A0A1C7LVQ3_GRIFR|nr:hypothetical protein A0H81_11654 [Grifola frondosa]